MSFRIAFLFAMLVLSMNVSVAFNMEGANQVEKATVLFASVILLMRGTIDRALILPALVIIFATALGAVLTSYPGFEWDLYFRQMVNLLSLLIFLTVLPKEEDRITFLKVMALVPLLQVAIGVFYAGIGLKPLMVIDSTIAVPRLAGSTGAPFLAGVAAAGSAAALFIVESGNKKYLWLAAINLLICLLTAGRMATFAAILCCGAIFIFGLREMRTVKLTVMIAGLIVGGVFLATFGDALLARALSGDQKGRELIRPFLLGIHDMYPYFGVGFGHQYTLVPRDLVVKTGTIAAHNEYIKYLVELGQVTGALFALGWLMLFAATCRSSLNRSKVVYVVMISAFLLYSLTDNTFVRNEVSFLLVIAAYGTRRMIKRAGLAAVDRRSTPRPVPALDRNGVAAPPLSPRPRRA